jgi:hypothetical protein
MTDEEQKGVSDEIQNKVWKGKLSKMKGLLKIFMGSETIKKFD